MKSDGFGHFCLTAMKCCTYIRHECECFIEHEFLSSERERESERAQEPVCYFDGRLIAPEVAEVFQGERLKMQPFFVNTQWAAAERALVGLAAAGKPSLPGAIMVNRLP